MLKLCFVNFLQISEKPAASKSIVKYARPLLEPDEVTVSVMRAEEPGILATHKIENG